MTPGPPRTLVEGSGPFSCSSFPPRRPWALATYGYALPVRYQPKEPAWQRIRLLGCPSRVVFASWC
jgi:hypothetical protein